VQVPRIDQSEVKRPSVELPNIVVVGASWGGLSALSTLIAGLPESFTIPTVLVQHRSKDSDSLLGQLLQYHTHLVVTEVEDKEPVCPGHIYVAPADYHLLIDRGHFSLTTDPLVRYSRPSIDVTFISASDACGAGVIGVVLTGANEDGSDGLRRIAARGGRAIIQDPATAEVRTMPAAALVAVPTAEVLPVEAIGPRLGVLAAAAAARVAGRRA
jgi:two-component system chemotaxis response regulator CheB